MGDMDHFEVEGLGTFLILGAVIIASIYLPKLKVFLGRCNFFTQRE